MVDNLREIVDNLGFFPTVAEMKLMGHKTLVNALIKIRKWSEWAKLFGAEPGRKPADYWRDFDNVARLIEPFVVDGRAPTLNFLITQVGHIIKYGVRLHGGYEAVLARMKLKCDTIVLAEDGHRALSTYELILDNYLYSRGISHDVDKWVNDQRVCRYDFRIELANGKPLFIEIWGYDNKHSQRCQPYIAKRRMKEEFYKNLGLDLLSFEKEDFIAPLKWIEDRLDRVFADLGFDVAPQRPFGVSAARPGIWTAERVIEEARQIMDATGERPSYELLRAMGRWDLIRAIDRCLGGFYNLYVELDCVPDMKPRNYWSKECIWDTLREITRTLGRVPNQKWLEDNGFASLVQAALKFGGLRPAFLDPLHAELGTRSTRRYYDSQDDVVNEMVEILQTGHEPTKSWMCKHGHSGAYNASKRFDGFEICLMKAKAKLKAVE